LPPSPFPPPPQARPQVDNGSTPAKLLDFYLFQQGSPNIRSLLNSTGIVDLGQVEGQINSTKSQVVSEVRAGCSTRPTQLPCPSPAPPYPLAAPSSPPTPPHSDPCPAR
jgi:hypothetical protein